MSNENGNSFTDIAVDTESDVVEQISHEQNLSDAFTEKQQLESANLEDQDQPEDLEAESPEQKKTEEPDKFASRFAALSRKEKEIRQREQQIELRMTELEEKLKSKEEPVVEKEPEIPLEYRLKKNPLETLSELGLSYDKLTELALNDGKLTTDMQMQLMRQELEDKYKSEIDSLRDEYISDKKAQEEEKYQQTLNSFVNELTEFVNKSDEFELVKANDGVQLVYDVIEEHYNETGEILENSQAAKLVEEYYEEELKKLSESKKLQSMFNKPAEVQEPATTERQPSPTLSNTMGTQVSTKGVRKLSEEESKSAAAQLLKWDN